MDDFRLVEPVHYTVVTADRLSTDKPYAWFDLDGTLTRADGKLLAAIFIEKNPEFGSESARAELANLYEAFLNGKLQYDPYLISTQRAFANILHSTGKTDTEVREISNNFFKRDGYKEVLPIARPMVEVIRKLRCNVGMITGAPQVVADPFAAYIGIDKVFAMPAEKDANGRFTKDAYEEFNTGLLGNKGSIARIISRRCASIFGAGNTQSDTCVLELAYLLGEDNAIDMKGFAFLMNTGQIGDPIVERFMKSAGHKHAEFAFHCIPRQPVVPKFISFFRALLRGAFVANGYESVLDEIDEKRPMTGQEKEELHRQREMDPDCWRLTS